MRKEQKKHNQAKLFYQNQQQMFKHQFKTKAAKILRIFLGKKLLLERKKML
jgi:hypothetical protein